jgi:hypothetical protein
MMKHPFKPIENLPEGDPVEEGNRRLREQIRELEEYRKELLNEEAGTHALRDKLLDLKQ